MVKGGKCQLLGISLQDSFGFFPILSNLQLTMKVIIATCKNIVGHFHDLSVTSHNFKRIQESLNIAQHKLSRMSRQRWNFTFYILRLVQE